MGRLSASAPAVPAKPRQLRGEDDAMRSHEKAAAPRAAGKSGMDKLLEQYGCGPIQFTGTGERFTSGTSCSTTSSMLQT